MRILVTNDDGPPSNQSSPYVHTLIAALQQAGHDVSVCLPHVQRSWIGKAHMIGQQLTASYFRPGTILQDDGIVSETPFNDGKEEWVLVDGTPASCVQIGLHHVFKHKTPFDLVLSGPNYGRNTTALFALSSGTIGGAMEGAVNGVKSIALSYAFDSREHDADVLTKASKLSTRLIEKLVKEWPEDVQLYSINVPLRKGVESTKIVYTEMIQNRWYTSSFQETAESTATHEHPNEEERKIRDNDMEGGAKGTGNRAKVMYKWAPQFADVKRSVEEAGIGDGWSVIQGHVSVTPLRANFWHVSRYSGEIKLDSKETSIPIHGGHSQRTTVNALIDYPEPYVQPLILNALENSDSIDYKLVKALSELPDPTSSVLQFTAYEELDFEHAAANPTTSLICAYMIRKALIRKHYLSNTISTWLVKHPESILGKHFKTATHFELDFAEFLDDALVDAWDLNESMQRNESIQNRSDHEWWILKPGMSDGGNGIRLFSTMEGLQSIFEEWDPEEEDDEEDENNEDGDQVSNESQTHGNESDDHAPMTSQLRHFIAQPYIDPPLLLPGLGSRKFHIRTYVVASGALDVYVYREMLALFAAKPYTHPGNTASSDVEGETPDLSSHLTNTCFQDESTKSSSVFSFWSLASGNEKNDQDWKQKVFDQICGITGEMFEAAAREQMVHFQTTPNSFEVFGLDFLVDAAYNVWVLEVNAYPDFKQTGIGLQDEVVGGLFREVVEHVVTPFFQRQSKETKVAGKTQDHDTSETRKLVLVKQVDMGRG